MRLRGKSPQSVFEPSLLIGDVMGGLASCQWLRGRRRSELADVPLPVAGVGRFGVVSELL